ncbi:hypothetical protein H5410_023403 [Solanum commersonii]|uniref:Uncharacterized protein n=1 Tax=Solanum commersonii TaxID=4109 RepID=A0A9J5ZHG3_SOLCO|nr:hypothetical protein H5410_023403 [Solanum commersonii]
MDFNLTVVLERTVLRPIELGLVSRIEVLLLVVSVLDACMASESDQVSSNTIAWIFSIKSWWSSCSTNLGWKGFKTLQNYMLIGSSKFYELLSYWRSIEASAIEIDDFCLPQTPLNPEAEEKPTLKSKISESPV